MNEVKINKEMDQSMNINIEEILKNYSSYFSEMKKVSRTSKMLYKIKVTDEFSRFITNMVKNPLPGNFDAYIQIQNYISVTIDDSVKAYFEANKSYISKAYKAKNTDSNLLHYTVFLKNHNAHYVCKLNEFIDKFEKTQYSKFFTVVFQDVPRQVEAACEKNMQNGKFERIM